ncbi:MAG: tetratricopeptide repeat protein [candidate division KSB1 bacterium]|nr:tetratricopeptide repeat protein [candidate division KSB1 bacterium]MDZ7333918.1 tetratricopeptide repeat protein [candidate division KSB1 bacterium]MDZ7358297.1 tetratricopeptide repeat protein [candidate division KSB1 bacterium]MDZ7399164.1 tetratricopeptide repeat protein [candidate division KSB1 bacterium]
MRTLNALSPFRLFGMLLTLALFVIAVLVNFHCAPTTQQTGPVIDDARQKAIRDSLRKVYEYELNKTWSTAFEHYKNKNYESAINPFWKVIELDTIERFKDQKYALLSDSYIKLNKPDSAQIVLEMGVKAYPGNAYLHRTLAYFLDSRGQTEEAIAEYQKATEIDPSRPADWKALGNLYIKTNQIQEATQAFEKAAELDPKDQDTQKILSRLYKTTGDSEAAIKRMEEVKRLDPNNAENLFNLGREYFNLGDFNNAILNLELMLKLKPNDVTAMEYLGNALQNRGDFRRAINVYNEILKLKSDNIKVMCDMATSYRELGQFPTARNYARQALSIDPKYGLARIVIGEIYESAAEKCYTARGKKMPEFDDKLIYDLAYQEYSKAAQDPQFRDLAERKMNYVSQSRPTKEDLFFHKGQTKPKDPCYDWIYK